MLSISQFVRPCVSVSVCLFLANFALLSRICWLLVFLTPFNGLFAPTYWSPMSKLFRFLESLRKSIKRSGLRFKTFAHEACKITEKKVSFLANFALLAGFFFKYCCYYPHLLRDALSPNCGIFTPSFNFNITTNLLHPNEYNVICLSSNSKLK